ncbi:MAG: 23S rRNA (uracil(1939)-C(5))-methyltransferase RlmD [Bacteroidales bacterium]|mgnify:CR=1 FL=1|nr:23S rRNA (uracil(1939)-C(5))-methyltransferase RlmD [Bacteroidales bacterium]
MARKKQLPVLRGVTITDIGSEGNAIAKVDEMVLFVPGMIPGDVVDVRVTKKKKRYMEGVALTVITPSPDRAEPPCRHFGVCGGCRWQHLTYDKQLFYKAKQVRDNLTRIGHTPIPEIDPIVGSEKIYGYRNKLEFTFSERRWMTAEELESWITSKQAHQAGDGDGAAAPSLSPALGFHIPGVFDKVLDINECLLMSEPADSIRNEVRRYALERKLPFYDFREHRGFLRTMFVRITTGGEVMVVLVTTDARAGERNQLLKHLAERFPEITSLWYVINTKKNDSIADLTPVHFRGSEYITESMEGLRFRIGPKSFYQTNSLQAAKLYGIVKEFAQLRGDENVYDLYTGTGTIACYLASGTSRVTGIEYIEEAVADARINALENGILNAEFIAGDIKDIFNEELFALRGRPDVIITDPPRAGMHADVVRAMLRSGARKIVYVSCNPATQARDIDILSEGYEVLRVRPVDMFPHTFHVENVVLLARKK